MTDVVIVEAVRSAVGKRNGGLSRYPAPDLFSDVLAALVDRTGIDSAVVGQITGGCVSRAKLRCKSVPHSSRSRPTARSRRLRISGSTAASPCSASRQR